MKRLILIMSVALILIGANVKAGDKAKDSKSMSDVIGEIKTDRQIKEEGIIDAPVKDVWNAWTTTDGITKWLVAKAKIELKIGGSYEVYFSPDAPAGSRGSEGCHVLSFLPMQMLSFEWNAPPAVPELRNAGMRNWVVVQFEDIGDDRTRIVLTHMGWGEGQHWDKCFSYFTNAWPNVIKACRDYFGEEG